MKFFWNRTKQLTHPEIYATLLDISRKLEAIEVKLVELDKIAKRTHNKVFRLEGETPPEGGLVRGQTDTVASGKGLSQGDFWSKVR